MGNWNISIQGTGCHHNLDLAVDADRMAARFVRELREAGHQVETASFTAGGKTDLIPPRDAGDPHWSHLAEAAYRAYGQTTDFKNFRGDPMPAWPDLPEAIRAAWTAAARTVKAVGG